MTDQQSEALRPADDLTRWMPNGLTENAAAELRRLHEEVQEQCRLNGMGAERELSQMARIAALEQALGMAVEALEFIGDAAGKEALATARQTLGGAA